MGQSAGAMRAIELRAFAQRLLEVADEIEASELPVDGARQTPPAVRVSPKAMQLCAMAIYRMRRRRTDHLPSALLGEVGWDMLLDLFVHAVDGKQVSTTSLCHAAEAPIPTGLRWIAILEQHGLVERRQSETDARVTYVNLSDEGMRRMSALLATRAQAVSPESGFMLPG